MTDPIQNKDPTQEEVDHAVETLRQVWNECDKKGYNPSLLKNLGDAIIILNTVTRPKT